MSEHQVSTRLTRLADTTYWHTVCVCGWDHLTQVDWEARDARTEHETGAA